MNRSQDEIPEIITMNIRDTINEKQNIEWGDRMIPLHKEPETIGIAHQNVNGLCPYGDWGHLETLAHNLNKQNIHILSISEPNICWTEERKERMKRSFNRHVRHPRIITANMQANTTTNSTLYQPGGTMIVCHDK